LAFQTKKLLDLWLPESDAHALQINPRKSVITSLVGTVHFPEISGSKAAGSHRAPAAN